MHDIDAWAAAEFGHAKLGDARRTRRLVSTAAEVARRPAPTVSHALASSASREGAFRLLENRAVRHEAVGRASHGRTFERCAQEALVYIAVDGSSITLRDPNGELGGVGTWKEGARGVQAMTCFAVSESGVPLGVCAQDLWVRQERSKGRQKDPVEKKETRYWLRALSATYEAFQQYAPRCTPWFQLDRGADAVDVLRHAQDLQLRVTVRAAYRRKLADGGELWAKVQRAPVLATRRIEVPARPARVRKKRIGNRRRISVPVPATPARVATVAIRACSVQLACSDRRTKRQDVVTMNVVMVREKGRGPGKDPLEWVLLTTSPVRTRKDALRVVDGYAQRWRIEEFHRTWKRGLCCVEQTQLRSREAIFKWAVILSAVAARAMRITYLARDKPDLPATEEFSDLELDAILALREPKNLDPNAVLSLAQVVRWIADIGGYTGPWNGPPGPTVVGRGLHDVLVTARALGNRERRKASRKMR